MDTKETTKQAENLPAIAPTVNTNKAMHQRTLSIEIADKIINHVGNLNKSEGILPTFGGTEIVTVLAILQPITQTTKKAVYEVSKHYVQYVKGGNKTFVPIEGKANQFDLKIEGGTIAYKKERNVIEKADKGEATHLINVAFKAEDVESFNKTVGNALQAMELKIFAGLKNGRKFLKNNKPVVIALQVGNEVISSNDITENNIEAKYLQPETYAKLDDKGAAEVWQKFCTSVFQSLKAALTSKNEVIKVNDVYKAIVGVK
jgi:hypothetical protein